MGRHWKSGTRVDLLHLQYKVTGRSGATVRSGEPLDSPIQCTLTPGTIVEVSEVRGRQVLPPSYFGRL